MQKTNVEDLASKFRDQVYYFVIPLLADGIYSKLYQKGPLTAELQEIYQTTIKVFFKLLFVAYVEDKDFFLPDEINLLKLSIRFELASAKFALLNRDKENLSVSIFQVKNYLRNYYDLTNLETQNVYDDLSKITNLDISPPNIDITSSLESIRALIRMQNESEPSEEIAFCISKNLVVPVSPKRRLRP